MVVSYEDKNKGLSVMKMCKKICVLLCVTASLYAADGTSVECKNKNVHGVIDSDRIQREKDALQERRERLA